jgi:UDP-N-acetylglucosamine 2-epimerase (non-hydrolysing)
MLMQNCQFIIPDTCGIKKECTVPNIHRKSFVLRTSTERQEAVDAGFAEQVGVAPKNVLDTITEWWVNGANVPNRKSQFGNGTSAEKTVETLQNAGYC